MDNAEDVSDRITKSVPIIRDAVGEKINGFVGEVTNGGDILMNHPP